MASAQDLAEIQQRYLKAIDAFSVATAPITEHMKAGTMPTAEELRREADAVAVLQAARKEFLAVWIE